MSSDKSVRDRLICYNNTVCRKDEVSIMKYLCVGMTVTLFGVGGYNIYKNYQKKQMRAAIIQQVEEYYNNAQYDNLKELTFERSIPDDVKTNYYIGKLYLQDKYKNYKEAFKLLSRASELGDAKAQYEVGKMYSYGLGGVVDFKMAVWYLQEAIKQEETNAMNMLGVFYFEGVGVDRDFEKGLLLVEESARLGNVGAKKVLLSANLNSNNYTDDVDIINKEGYYNEKVALLAAEMFRYGIGVHKDIKKSTAWFSYASKFGNKYAIQQLKKRGGGDSFLYRSIECEKKVKTK